MGRRWRRPVALLCTLLLAGSVFLVLGVTVWAQEQPQPTQEQPTGTGQQPQTAQPTQQPAQQKQGLTIDYWEPKIGTRTVYYIEDLNDAHGNIFGTSALGYWDAGLLYSTSACPVNYSAARWYGVEAISNMNMVYFDLAGPWYFNMTTPHKYIEEVIGIHEAPDAAQFPQATYAARYLIIASGGVRAWGERYLSNDANEKKWREWGFTLETFYPGDERSTRYIVHYRSPSDKKTPVSRVIISFPLSVGTTGSVDAVYQEGGVENKTSEAVSYEVIAEGKITVPAGTYDALLVKGNLTAHPNGEPYAAIEYAWFVSGLGFVCDVASLPNEMGPLFEQATDIQVMESQTDAGGGQSK